MNRTESAAAWIVLGVALLTCGCKQPQAPTTPGVPDGPNSGNAGVAYTYTTVSADPDGDNIEYVFGWGDSSKDTTPYLASGASAAASHSWAEADNYPVRARAIDQSGLKSDTSEPHWVEIFGPGNQPPLKPAAPSGPSSGTVNASYDFTVSTTDPESEQVAFRFVFETGTATDWGGFVAGSADYSLAHTWTQAGTYEVKTQAKDTNGKRSPWSPPHSITITQ